MLIIVAITIHTLSTGFLLPGTLTWKPVSQTKSKCAHTYTHKTQNKQTLHTDYMYLFIYHVCMQ